MIYSNIKYYGYSILAFILNYGITFAQSRDDMGFYYDTTHEYYDSNLTITPIIDTITDDQQSSFLYDILKFLKIDGFIISNNSTPALGFITNLINIALGLASFISLVIIIYGFAKIFFAKDDEGLSDAKKIVQNTAIALVIIAVSWLLVSFLFVLYNRFVG